MKSENVPKEEYLAGNYAFLFWYIDGFEIFIKKFYLSIKKTKYIIQILDMQYRKIIDFSKIL